MKLLFVIFAALLALAKCQYQTEYNKQLEDAIMKGYNNKHRPVKLESSVVQVSVYMSISHVEKVDEKEQTMMVHGHLWASWLDEYLTWDPSKYNNTQRINIDAWRIWQPALALYNSARGNSWHLYMHGLPAMVGANGKVWASGAFSFHVTCKFDFSLWPDDEQECPIVIADWVYDLSRVNLSDPLETNEDWVKPTVRLNYDPIRNDDKKHAAGWEITDTWRRHCYWGPTGCRNDVPDGSPEWYWSLLEFGIRLKRHAPYIFMTITLPTLITSAVTLVSFWIECNAFNANLLVVNILLQGLFGWDVLRELPPGSGDVPKLVILYATNFFLTCIAFIIEATIAFIKDSKPEGMALPFKVPNLLYFINISKITLFHGLKFDATTFISHDDTYDYNKEYNSPISITNPLAEEEEEENHSDGATLIPIDEAPLPTTTEELPTSSSSIPKFANKFPFITLDTKNHLYITRVFFFYIYFIAYFVAIVYCLF